MKNKMKEIGILLLYGILSSFIVYIVFRNGIYPSGSDTMCHIYKGDVLYQEILKGNWYPLFDSMWYNGVEMMRYWAPLPVYVLAACQAIAGGNPLNGYLIFVGLIFFFGAYVWWIIGKRHKRRVLGAFLGIAWFFMPNNLFALFVEGNLPRSLCMVFLPLFVSYLYDYLIEDNWKSIAKMIPCFSLMALCHLGYAGMIALAVILYLVIYMILYRQRRKVLNCILGMILGFLLIGIWAYASLQGGITSTDSSQVMKGFFQDAWISINPLYRITNGVGTAFYYGASMLALAVFGAVLSKRKSMPGFWASILIFICTTTSLYSFLVLLPGSQYLWMLRFISIALCFTLFSFLMWDSLKKKFVILICAFLILDMIPSYQTFGGYGESESVESRFAELQENTLIAKAKDITKQRLTLMDESTLGATASYLISGYDGKVAATFGAGWQSASTAHNIVQLNQAMDNGCYRYLFDRCIELGSDTVLIQIVQLKNGEEDVKEVDSAAKELGYTLVDKNNEYRLYHLDTYESFGVINTYRAIGIGTSASQISLMYPAVEETVSSNLNDYTFEQLSQYDVVYLDGFTYDDQKEAEQLVIKLSEAGTKVIVLADGIPTEKENGVRNFLGVDCFDITFQNGYPELDTPDGVFDCDLFPEGYSKWKTVYMNGLDQVYGSFGDLNQQLAFCGTVKNENLVMIGINLPYFYSLTSDEKAEQILTKMLGINPTELPKRERVPINIEYLKNEIRITSQYENVDTTISEHDIFSSDNEISAKNHLIYVGKGTTVIKMSYPYLLPGFFMSVIGIVLYGAFLYRIRKNKCKNEETT